NDNDNDNSEDNFGIYSYKTPLNISYKFKETTDIELSKLNSFIRENNDYCIKFNKNVINFTNKISEDKNLVLIRTLEGIAHEIGHYVFRTKHKHLKIDYLTY